MDNAVFQRRLDAAYVAKGGVLQSLDSIAEFLGAVEVEPDPHTIQMFLNRRSGKRDSVLNTQRIADDAVDDKAVASPRQQRMPQRRMLVSVGDCMVLAKQCIEVQRRKLVGGNEAHYLQLAWAGCGGDEDRKGFIPKHALLAQLEAFGVATDDTSTTSGFASDSEEPPQMSFHDLVGLVSVSKNVLDIASKCHDLSRIPSMLTTKHAGRHLSPEESKLMRWQTIALVRFKLRLRMLIHRRRKKKREEEILRANQAAMARSTSMRLGRGIAGGRNTHQRRSSLVSSLPPLAATTSLSLAPAAVSVVGALTSRMHSDREPPTDASPMQSPARGGNAVPPHVDLGDPNILHGDTSSCPWHRVHPFESTKLQKDWVALSPPMPTRRSGGSRLAASPGTDDASVAGSSRRRDGRGDKASLGQLRERLKVLLQERQQLAATGTSNGMPSNGVCANSLDDDDGSEQEGSVVQSVDGEDNTKPSGGTPPHGHVGQTATSGAARVVSFSSALVASTSQPSTRRQSSCGVDVACQCSDVEILTALHGASVAPWLLRQAKRRAAGTKASRPLLPPLPHAGKWKRGAS